MTDGRGQLVRHSSKSDDGRADSSEKMTGKRKKINTNPHLSALINYIDLNFLLEKISGNQWLKQ
jgi:hypothetical protein